MKFNLKKTLLIGMALAAISTSAAHATNNTINGSTPGPLTLHTGDTLTVNSGGSLSTTSQDDVVVTGTPAGTITIHSGGSVGATSGNAISVSSGDTSGAITNSGSVTASGMSGDRAIEINGTVSGGIDNNTGGAITGDGHGLEVNGAVTADGNGNAIYNNGTISSTGNVNFSDSSAIRLGGATITGNIFNDTSGIISGHIYGINLQSGTTISGGLTNSGIISGGAFAIWFHGGTITNGITNNSGGIIGNGAGDGIVVDSGGTLGEINNHGTISTNGGLTPTTGNALLNNGTISTINNNSGTITGTTGYAIFNDAGTITSLTNNGGVISATSSGGYAVGNENLITTFDNTGGTISATTNAIAFDNEGTVNSLINGTGGTITVGNGSYAVVNYTADTMNLTNNGLIHATDTVALYNAGNLTLNNTNGTISAITGSAIQLNAPLTTGSINQPYNVTNTNGLITSASTGNGTIYVTADIGTPTIIGGTISNTSTSNSAVAVNIAANQAGTYSAIDFDNVHLIADGDTPGSGHGIALTNGTGGSNAAVAEFSDNTVVRGNIVSSGSLHLLFYNASVTGNITLGGTNNELDITDGVTVAGNVAFGTGVNSFYVFPTVSFATGGTFATAGGGQTNLEIDSGTFIVNNAVGLGSGTILIYNGAALNLAAGDVTSTGAFTNNGTTSIGVGRSLNVGSIDTTAMNGVLSFTASSTGNVLNTGHINTGASAANLSNQTVDVNFIGGGNLSGTARSLIASGTGNATVPIAAVTDNSYLYDFTVVRGTGDANDLYLQTVVAVTPSEASDNSNNANAANVLLGPTINGNDPVTNQIQNNLNNAPNRQAFNNVVSSTLPTVDNNNAAAAASFIGDVFDVADSQLTTVDTGLQTGVAAGNSTHGLHPWMQGFGSYAQQGMRSDVAGYNASTYGAAFGLDTRELVDNTVLGISFAYGRTNATSQNINNTSTNVNTYQGMIYGNHQFAEDFFVTGMGAFGWDTNSQTRYNVGTIAGLDASANYNAWQAATRWEIGRNFKNLPTDVTLTPSLIGDYLHYQASGYSESGAGGANLTVGDQAENILNVGVGLQAEWLIETADGSRFRPNLHATYKYDVLNNDSIDTSSSYAAGGGTFTTNGLNPGNSTTTLGTGMKFYNTGNWDFTASYDHTFKADYNSDTGLIRAAYKF